MSDSKRKNTVALLIDTANFRPADFNRMLQIAHTYDELVFTRAYGTFAGERLGENWRCQSRERLLL